MGDLSALIQMTLLCTAVATAVAAPAVIALMAFNKYKQKLAEKS
ncbi:hypothetical protein [Enterovibrio nigricans]|uniref:Uncharacterized protein n=1 Tax=Enterovibrio nigricans DSM 22720 TaxID=1121868 RepID=A0A1T4VXI3_9GAMM|nr:hypothetical protein [Enterovibrio nigricans]SKA69720.1 hypothetical protein SAMN02745132_04495 [Enterovibrio nigricans DSM 22720]